MVLGCGNGDGLAFQLSVTLGAVGDGVVGAISAAGCSLLVLLNCLASGMTGSSDSISLTAQLFITSGAVNDGVIGAVDGAGCSLLVLLNCLSGSVAQSSALGCATGGAGLGINAVCVYPIVALNDSPGVGGFFVRAVTLSNEVGVCALGVVVGGVEALEGTAVDGDGGSLTGIILLVQDYVLVGGVIGLGSGEVTAIDLDVTVTGGVDGIAGAVVSTALDDDLTVVCPNSLSAGNLTLAGDGQDGIGIVDIDTGLIIAGNVIAVQIRRPVRT